MIAFFALQLLTAAPDHGVRVVKATSCDIIDVHVSLGMSVLLQFDSTPSLTFHADEEHFLVRSSDSAKRTLAIIPHVKEEELRRLTRQDEALPSGASLSKLLDRIFRTNLFVFFKNSSRLLFRFKFVEKERADYVLRIKQIYRKGCEL